MNITEVCNTDKIVSYFGQTFVVPKWTKSVCTDVDGSIWCISADKSYVHFNGREWITGRQTSGYLLGYAEVGTFSAQESFVEYD